MHTNHDHGQPPHLVCQDNPTRTSKRANHQGVYWHSGKLGWVLRDGTGGTFFTEADTIKAAKSRTANIIAAASVRVGHKSTKSPKRIAAVRSRFRHVVYHKTKQVARCVLVLQPSLSVGKHLWRQPPPKVLRTYTCDAHQHT